ncbi:MAG: serine hydrolase domain-containing protein [bacterium]
MTNAQDWASQIDPLFKDYDRPDVSGASVLVALDGKILHARGYGLANLDPKIPATELTNYRLASVTKHFTAMCIMILKDRGLLSFDDPLTKFFPDFPEIGKQITVLQILNHTSGLVAYEDLMPADTTKPILDAGVLALLKTQHGVYFTPGTQYRYSNTGYALLSQIVEKVSGQSFATFLKENIFAPLHMDNTVAFEDGISTVTRRAYGYKPTDDGFKFADQSMTSSVLGDGGIYTSVMDYYKWDQALYGQQLVTSATLAEAFTSGRLADGTDTNYGFGWRLSELNGFKCINHTGTTTGFNNAVYRIPEKRLLVVVLSNRTGSFTHDLAPKIASIILDEISPKPAPAP